MVNTLLAVSATDAPTSRSVMPPPGLVAPPGLELPAHLLAPPPGLDDSHPTPANIKATVRISGLPSHIASDRMFEVMLQQAGLDEFVANFSATPGKPFGQATVNLTAEDAASRCAHHFHGRCWGDAVVQARVDVPEASSRPHSTAAAKSAFTFSLAASEFIPTTSTVRTVSALKSSPPENGSDASTEDGEATSESE